ncbi:MAG: hypothetical protein LBN29_02550 [Mediterranea sp.]|jgi:hypothetical protein|nr:hypothetical protein [Mediterranea sp.]
MAKKKKTTASAQQPLSPERYIRERARTLPIEECLVTADLRLDGMASLCVARRHKQGTYTVGFYLVDLFCLGVKDSMYQFSVSEEEYEEMLDGLYGVTGFETIDYSRAHSIIYGAVAYAERLGIAPCEEFALTKYILEDAEADIPRVEQEFGDHGQPHLIVHSKLEASKYIPILEKKLGKDGFKFTLLDGMGEAYEEELDEYEAWDDEEDDDEEDEHSPWGMGEFSAMMEAFKSLPPEEQERQIVETLSKLMRQRAEDDEKFPMVTYTFRHPRYAETLDVENEEAIEMLDKDGHEPLTKEEIDFILSLPRESMAGDLEQAALYEMGRGLRLMEDSEDAPDSFETDRLIHVVYLLGTVNTSRSLGVVLEMLRQDSYFLFMFDNWDLSALVPTLYLLGRERLNELMHFVLEPGLDSYSHRYVFFVLEQIIFHEPQRREEALAWLKEVADLYVNDMADRVYCDGCMGAFLINTLVEVKATELLPEMEALFATGLINTDFIASLEQAKILMDADDEDYQCPVDIYERYENFDMY